MALSKPVLAVILLVILFEKNAESSESPSESNNDDTSSIPMIPSGKRQHNIMRFGKREESRPQHSFLYFGKRMSAQTSLPDLIQYLQKTNDKSYKRGHSIMRFGKRTIGGQDFMGYGGSDDGDDYDDYFPDGDTEESKRDGHNMMYFGKRGGHSMMYFGKRANGHNMLSFGKRDDGKSAHSMIHFGKREDYDDDYYSPEEKRAHSMIHFGKRENDDDEYPDEEIKRAAHSMIHFGKREYGNDLLPYWYPNIYDKKQHNLLRFGKKMDGMRKGSHAMIHFGKRDDDKRAHSMIHFGKRSVEQNNESVAHNQSKNGPSPAVSRSKRDAEEQVETVEPIVAYGSPDDEDLSPDEEVENALEIADPRMFRAGELLERLPYPYSEQDLMYLNPEFRALQKKEGSKNVFLRFG